MSYVKHILLPSERVLYDGHVHPTVLLPGLILLALAAVVLTQGVNTGTAHSLILGIIHFLAEYASPLEKLSQSLESWQRHSPAIALDLKILGLLVGCYGLYKLVTGFIVLECTELVITDQRVIAKVGVFTITTVEMDRRRIAGVTVYQPFAGRMLGYGYVLIQGFTSHIGGLPPMVNPHLVEKFID